MCSCIYAVETAKHHIRCVQIVGVMASMLIVPGRVAILCFGVVMFLAKGAADAEHRPGKLFKIFYYETASQLNAI